MRKKVILHPGDFYFTPQSVLIQTLLGSCIAMVMWHPKYHLGGMCHFVLAKFASLKADKLAEAEGYVVNIPLASEQQLDGRYAEDAFELFKRAINKHHTMLKDYQVSVYGGSQLHVNYPANDSQNVSTENCKITDKFIADHQLKISTYDLQGQHTRCLTFDTATGIIEVKRL